MPYLEVQRVMYTLTQAQYPTRPKNAKDTWLEPVNFAGISYFLSCRIDEDNKKIIVTNIRKRKK